MGSVEAEGVCHVLEFKGKVLMAFKCNLKNSRISRLSLSRLVRAGDQVLWDQGRDQAGFSTF